jgi:hypothetical protein
LQDHRGGDGTTRRTSSRRRRSQGAMSPLTICTRRRSPSETSCMCHDRSTSLTKPKQKQKGGQRRRGANNLRRAERAYRMSSSRSRRSWCLYPPTESLKEVQESQCSLLCVEGERRTNRKCETTRSDRTTGLAAHSVPARPSKLRIRRQFLRSSLVPPALVGPLDDPTDLGK